MFNRSTMSDAAERLERLITEEIGECCDADVAERVETLERYAGAQPADYERDLAALKALGNDTRYTIVRLLSAAGRELCVCEITPVVDVSDSAISHALSDLHDAGLVTRRKDGTWRYYESTGRARALLDALDATRDGSGGADR
jgi:DNA-binding transcriptional ArsR family regulator